MRYLPDLPASLAREAMGHTFSLWAEGRTETAHVAYQREQLARAGRSLLTYAGLVDDAGHLVASMKRFVFGLSAGDASASALGIGAVLVPPARRGLGFGHALVEHALSEARDAGLETAILFSEIDPRFYEVHGFRRHERAARRRALEEGTLEDDGCVVHRAVEATDLSFVATCEPPGGVSLTRDPARLVYFAWRNGFASYVVTRDRVAIGYFALARPNRETPSLELGDLAAISGAGDAVFRAAERAALRLGARTLETRIEAGARRQGYAAFAPSHDDGTPMTVALTPSFSIEGPASLGALDYF